MDFRKSMSIKIETALPADEMVTSKNVDLSNCDREQVQYPGAIQPHGFMLVTKIPGYSILQASSNTAAFLGVKASDLLGCNLSAVLSEEQVVSIDGRLKRENFEGAPLHVASATLEGNNFDVQAHRMGESLLLEFELRTVDQAFAASSSNLDDKYALFQRIHQAISRMSHSTDLQSFLDAATEEAFYLTGYERVLVYRFLEDGSGWVCSERLSPGLEPFLGLHYPPSDIPLPARRLFSLTWVRHQPDISYTPVRMVPELNPLTGQALDMSYALLRSVSVMYVDYLKNMGTQSSLVMTLMKEGRLWGMIACHHSSSVKHVPYEIRAACEILAHMVSLCMASKESEEQAEFKLSLRDKRSEFVRKVAGQADFAAALEEFAPDLLGLVRADGAAAVVNGKILTVGITPTAHEIQCIVAWLCAQPKQSVFSTAHLSSHMPEANEFASAAAGLTALCFNNPQKDFFLWFRPEILQTVNWAGDPNKPVDITDNGQRLTPRKSFALWKETVRWKSDPWLDVEVDAVKDLRSSLLELVLRKAEELGRLYDDLRSSYSELDAFAYAAAHDLKEPLRGIHAYAEMILDEDLEKLDNSSKAKVESIRRLAARMDQLINSLLSYSRIGLEFLIHEELDLNVVLADALDSLSVLLKQYPAKVQIMPHMPTLYGDRQRVLEVFTNLISNAIKYNDKPIKIVDVGFRASEQAEGVIFFVRDNGIGIAERHREDIFRIFHRLHGREQYGGGNGAGLTIVKKILELHGGRIWIESVCREGTSFLFSFGNNTNRSS
jgi:two-component system, chemotaxis family, sensor kinase Cph1